ncbi:hypothetical protein PRO82_000603 [Candidatus Protochlamydia amoebophila]|uniref:tetratricopeptide repeat protein n=1 Tax=Candidatus Protochlamydia amoebophila TaxID=362787 RepID=UPI001BD86EE8|nr:tetratricopeptide repeat protein [Candidatus Protochlamydia amoebophila]MBS4163303.1 hypothetical protein [Candidatus Protochlamydia amoebophila]
MQLKYIDDDAPSNYSVLPSGPDPKLSQSKMNNGKAYFLLGSFEKTYPLMRRIGIGIYAAFKTLYTLGLGLFSENVLEDWKTFWSGKKSKIIYSSSPPFLPIKLLADQGDAKAQYNLGVIYVNGLGVTQSDAKAFKYFKLAADQGDADAQYELETYKKGLRS